MHSIVIPQSIWERASAHLWGSSNERFAFFMAEIVRYKAGVSFLVKDVILVKDEDINFFSPDSIINQDVLLHTTNEAKLKGLAIVEAHTHPFSSEKVTFSSIDTREMDEFANYMIEVLGLPYGATVWGSQSVDGLCWAEARQNPEPISEVRIVGQDMTRLPTTASKGANDLLGAYYDKNDRQILAIGKKGQSRIGNTRVAIAGGGGIASHVIQQLAYLGVRDFDLIDFDRVEWTNLNRLVGAMPSDVGKLKVEVMERLIRSVADEDSVRVNALAVDIRHPDAINALKRADVIFGCVDNDGARLVLNEIALAYYIPLIDSAVGIFAKDEKIEEAGGRVVVVHPDAPCLLCAGEIMPTEAYNDLAPREEIEAKKHQGYVSGEDVPSPSVISLNGTMASMAVTEFLALVAGVRPVKEGMYYDMLEQQSGRRETKPNAKCYSCSLKGVGDRANVERYSIGISEGTSARTHLSLVGKLILWTRFVRNRIVAALKWDISKQVTGGDVQ